MQSGIYQSALMAEAKVFALQTVKVLFCWHRWYFLYCIASLGNSQHTTRHGTWFPSYKDTFYLEMHIHLQNLQSEVFSAGGNVAGPISEEESKLQMVFRLWQEQEAAAGWRLFSCSDGLMFSPGNCWFATWWCRTSFWAPSRQKEVLNIAISQADVCNKSRRSGELYSIWHVKWLLQVGIKTKKTQHIQEQPATN